MFFRKSDRTLLKGQGDFSKTYPYYTYIIPVDIKSIMSADICAGQDNAVSKGKKLKNTE